MLLWRCWRWWRWWPRRRLRPLGRWRLRWWGWRRLDRRRWRLRNLVRGHGRWWCLDQWQGLLEYGRRRWWWWDRERLLPLLLRKFRLGWLRLGRFLGRRLWLGGIRPGRLLGRCLWPGRTWLLHCRPAAALFRVFPSVSGLRGGASPHLTGGAGACGDGRAVCGGGGSGGSGTGDGGGAGISLRGITGGLSMVTSTASSKGSVRFNGETHHRVTATAACSSVVIATAVADM